MTWLLGEQAQSKHGTGTGQARCCAQTDSGGGVELSLRWKLVEFRGLGRGRGYCRYCRHIADILPQIAADCGGKRQIVMEGVMGCVP